MLNPQAKAAAATEEPDGRSVSELVLDGRHWRCVAGTSGHPGRFRRRGSLLVLHGDGHQGTSSQEMRIDGLPIWGMLGSEVRSGAIMRKDKRWISNLSGECC
jgi:hypothetical protein